MLGRWTPVWHGCCFEQAWSPSERPSTLQAEGSEIDIGAFEVQLILCRANYDADAVLTTSDLFLFLTDFFAEAPRADFNADGVVTSSDVFDYIAAFLTGC